MPGLLQTAAEVRKGKLKISDVPENRRKKIQRLLDDYGKELDAVGQAASTKLAFSGQAHVRAARMA